MTGFGFSIGLGNGQVVETETFNVTNGGVQVTNGGENVTVTLVV